MPFIVTCDHCSAKLRTPARLADGREVNCAKCGAPFVIRADNQRDEAAPAAGPGWEVVEDEPAPAARPAARRAAVEVDEDDGPSPPRRRAAARRDEDDEDRPRRSRRARDEDDEDDRPRGKGEGPGRGRVYWWVGGGLAAALLVGAGLYFVLRKPSGPGGEVEEALAARPKRELPKDLFAYWPSDQYSLTYTDYSIPAAEGGLSKPATVADAARNLGVTPEQVARHLYCSSRAAAGDVVTVYELKSALDLSKAAAAGGYEPVPVAGGTVFRTERVQAFQPRPTLVVVWDKGFASSGVKNPPTQQTEELLRRGPGSTRVPDGLWELLQEVSGYPSLSGAVAKPGDELIPVSARFRVDGYGDSGTERENLTCWAYASPAEAKRAEDAFRQVDAALAQKMSGLKDKSKDKRYWVRESRLFRFDKQPATPAPKPSDPKPSDPRPAGLSAEDHAKKLKEHGVPAPRDIPKAHLTYLPAQDVSLTYTDCAALRAAGQDSVYLPDAFILSQLGLADTAVDRVVQFNERTTAANYSTAVTYLLNADYSLDKNPKAGGPGVRKRVVDGRTTYLVSFSSKPVVLFQPDPRTVVSVSRNLGPGGPTDSLVSRVVALTPETAKPPDNLYEALREVSGFPSVTLYPHEMSGLTGSARTRYEATGTGPAPKRTDTYKVQPYPTAAAAEEARARREKYDKPKPDPARPTVQDAWAHGNALYVYTRTTKTP